ncbi:MAG: hypothetical protein QF628_01520 [Acidimicrobiales bacterium]|nr:hypothetical protein [Acidimicrobiales bacterium]MDP7411260.1 hypothetical protein [Acidimicrobiales bacterium]MEE1522588.1 hypothetical protein [Acidimicrobiales bacterium]MEE1571313.1 hypothetical protein [Acidimicrobiales bacterium]
MFIRRLESVNAFLAVDLADAPGTGVARLAPKILQGGAKDLARSMTYALASLERRETGISAGINAGPDNRASAVVAFAGEVAGWEAHFRLTPGRGIEAGELDSLGIPLEDDLVAVSAVAAAMASMPGATTASVMGGDVALDAQLASANLTVIDTDDPVAVTCDLLFCGSKVGAIDHLAAARLGCSVVVPTGPLPLTARAIAVCRQRGITALPDFITTCGPLVADSEGAAATTAASIVAEVLGHPDGVFLGACERAESFLAGWQDHLPFGRPMAP